MNTIKYVSEEAVIAAIEEFNKLLGFPDNTGTITYCNIPTPNENGEYIIEIDNQLDVLINDADSI